VCRHRRPDRSLWHLSRLSLAIVSGVRIHRGEATGVVIHVRAVLLVVLWRLRLELVLRRPLGRLLPIYLMLRTRILRILVRAVGGCLVMARAIHRLRVLVLVLVQAKVVSGVCRSGAVVMGVEFMVERVMFVHGGDISPNRR